MNYKGYKIATFKDPDSEKWKYAVLLRDKLAFHELVHSNTAKDSATCKKMAKKWIDRELEKR